MSPSLDKSEPFESQRRLLLLTALAYIFAYTATHVPAHRIPGALNPHDKLMHGLTYFVLGLLSCLWLCRAQPELSRSTHGMLSMLIVSIYALFDEVTQPIVRRTFEFADLVADWTGAALGIVIASAVVGRRVR